MVSAWLARAHVLCALLAAYDTLGLGHNAKIPMSLKLDPHPVAGGDAARVQESVANAASQAVSEVAAVGADAFIMKSSLLVDFAGSVGGLPNADVHEILTAIGKAAGPEQNPVIATVTDSSMVDLAKNMLTSLETVGTTESRLVISIGSGACAGLKDFKRTHCVEVWKDSHDSEEASWGTHEYWQIVFRKHVLVTVIASCGLSNFLAFTDPDIVYFKPPVAELQKELGDWDIAFAPNNYLEAGAKSTDDVAADYEKRGMDHLRVGPYSRKVDINTGLFISKKSAALAELMLRTAIIFKDQEFVHGHYQQFSLVEAMKAVPQAKVGAVAADKFVNGNVFWAHREILDCSKVVSVHANWMDSALKRPCFNSSHLWFNKEVPWVNPHDSFTTDEAFGKTVISCGGISTADVEK